MYLLYASKEVLIMRINFVIDIAINDYKYVYNSLSGPDFMCSVQINTRVCCGDYISGST